MEHAAFCISLCIFGRQVTTLVGRSGWTVQEALMTSLKVQPVAPNPRSKVTLRDISRLSHKNGQNSRIQAA